MFTLQVLQGPDKGLVYRLGDEPTLIGRYSDQVRLTDDSTSRRHTEIRPANGSWALVDLGSSNGTYLNGRRIVNPTLLKHGDQIKVGTTLLVFGGQEHVRAFTGPDEIRDLVDLDMGGKEIGASILSSVAASQESVILPPPETADAVAAWNIIYKIAEMIGTSESVHALLESVADIILDDLIVDHLVMLVKDDTTSELIPQVLRYRYEDRNHKPQIITSKRIINHVLSTKDGVLCANAMTDERFSPENSQDSIHRLGLRSVICVPVAVRGEVKGIIHMDCSMSRLTYTQEQLRLVVAIGRLAGMAIENARLLESRMRTERLAAAGETVSYLSHHIRNIVQGLHGGGDVVELGMRNCNIETIKSGWEIVRRNLEHTSRLTMDMLTFTKDRRPNLQTAQLNAVVEKALALVQNLADEKSVMILKELGEIPAIPFDPEGVHQVAHNILLNAVEAVPENSGRINIHTAYDSDSAWMVLTIADNGPGVPPEHSDHIFEAFHSTKGHAGTGLGLAAARKIIAEHDGLIDVENTPGGGATFHIKLPVVHPRTDDKDGTHGPAPVDTH